MRDSPKHPRNRLADSVASASEFVGRRGFKFGKKGDRGGDGGVRRLVVLTVIALGLLVLLERSWNGEESMFRTGRKMDDFAGLRSMDIKEKERLESVLNQDLAYNQRHAQSNQVDRPEEPVDRWIRVSRPAPARLDNPPPPSRPSPEFAVVPSAYTFDPSQRFIFVGWMGEQVRSKFYFSNEGFANSKFSTGNKSASTSVSTRSPRTRYESYPCSPGSSKVKIRFMLPSERLYFVLRCRYL